MEIVGPAWAEGRILAVRYIKPTLHVSLDRSFAEAIDQDYDMIILTGGAWNATVVRTNSHALDLVTSHYDKGRLVAAICAGPVVLINAGLTENLELTATGSVRIDLENAGATFIDAPVVFSNNILTGRGPSDLQPFGTAIGQALQGVNDIQSMMAGY